MLSGTTPFAHISTCIRSHLRRAQIAEPPYHPIITSFELVGALTAHEIRAVGLRSDERPAVKRGTLWYLDERVFGKGVGADDPFVRSRVDAGLSPSEKDGIYVRGPVIPSTSSSYQPTPPFLHDEEEDETGMGRGKRKRRASSAAMSMTDSTLLPGTGTPGSPAANNTTSWTPPMHRRSTTAGSLPAAKPTIPRLRLRLTSLEEVDSMDDSDAGSDVPSRRTIKKKFCRATSEGGVSKAGSAESEEPVDDEAAEVLRRSAFSSALLAQSLLAASISTPTLPSPATKTPHPHSNVSPGSLHLATVPDPPRRPHHHLSASAPNLLSVLHSRLSPDSMDAEFPRAASEDYPDSVDEDDFHEAMLRGEDFDFEWGSESYTATLALPSYSQKSARGKPVEGSAPPEVEELDLNDMEEEENDSSSTPATTPRSPAREEDPELPVGSSKGGLEATLCEACEDEETDQSKPVLQLISEYHSSLRYAILTVCTVDRVDSTESLTSLDPEEDEIAHLEPPSGLSRQLSDSSALTVPLPSPLSIDLPPMLGNAYSSDYDFVGMEDDDRSAYRNQYDRDAGDSADEEDDDEIMTVKVEDEGSVGPEDSVNSSRASSAYPTESFTRRLTVGHSQSSSSSSSSDGDHFDPHSIISNSMLASGESVPHDAPSPPEMAEWGMHLDLDELDVELGSGVDLLGPESVGLEELDLAWGGPAEKASDETEEEWRIRREGREKARKANGSVTFLTRSPTEIFTPLVSPTATPGDPGALVIPVYTNPSTLSGTRPIPRPSPSPTATSPFFTTQGSPLIVYPTSPLNPSISALIVQRGVAVYATTLVDLETQTPYPLLRKIDSDYVNATVLLKGTSASAEVRSAILGKFTETFTVSTGTAGLQGTWVSLLAARSIAEKYSSLDQYEVFLEEELGARFPDPISSLRARSSSIATATPPLASPSLPPPSVPTTTPTSPAPTIKKSTRAGRGQRRSGDLAGVDLEKERQKESRDSSPEFVGVKTSGGRKSRRSLAAASGGK